MALITVLFLFFLFSIGFCNEGFNSHLLPRTLMLEYPENGETQYGKFDEELLLQCTSWRFAA
ncbi:hypothetical protein SLEP1_g28024 [Rubroshorea leprosula]|uniref:Uncharacterized protein n=1 Tax=Rubroshorea leprosula TaxID=152421 RepID=A0AAV5K1M6_9ROSI|nr:hypothetical protein SLEP1_g28024 [Rubroshorea leprosula]